MEPLKFMTDLEKLEETRRIHNKINGYNDGRADGTFQTLIAMKEYAECQKGKQWKEFVAYIQACLNDLRLFMEWYGFVECVFTERDNKGNVKAKIYPPQTDFVRTKKGLVSRKEVFDLLIDLLKEREIK